MIKANIKYDLCKPANEYWNPVQLNFTLTSESFLLLRMFDKLCGWNETKQYNGNSIMIVCQYNSQILKLKDLASHLCHFSEDELRKMQTTPKEQPRMPQTTTDTTAFESHYALAHQVFWTVLADRYRAKQTIKSVFIAEVIMDWLFDTNVTLDSIDETTVLMTWGTPADYDQALLDSLLNPRDYLRGIKDLYRQHKAEIKAELGDRPLDEIDDFSNDYYLAYGFMPRAKHHRK